MYVEIYLCKNFMHKYKMFGHKQLKIEFQIYMQKLSVLKQIK